MTVIADLDTPALLVDLPRLRRNIAAMQTLADQCGVALRPHTKTHKAPAIARMQVQAGARGITVAKVGEAEVMVAAGFTDLFIAYPLIGEQKYRRLEESTYRYESGGGAFVRNLRVDETGFVLDYPGIWTVPVSP